ncbi:MAG: hypothetical protein DMG03_09600 [Acidobacteria bacterium]|nr:MAG: hypothetical protein DMG03_09600 [Acidobacteriota bacterium]
MSYNIDGATVNWPGGGGGATMLYYDQGMFEEVNYMTSAIPAEVMVGGVSINMVTKDAGNKWRGDARYNFSSGCLEQPTAAGQRATVGCLETDNVGSGIDDGTLPTTFLGNPTKTTWDFNLAGGGAIVTDRLWVNGSIRRWIVDKLVAARNANGTQAIDDNTLKNYSGKGVYSQSPNQKVMFSYNCRLARTDQSRLVDAGQVHRRPQAAGVRVGVQPDEGTDQLLLSTRHAGHGGAHGRRDAE